MGGACRGPLPSEQCPSELLDIGTLICCCLRVQSGVQSTSARHPLRTNSRSPHSRRIAPAFLSDAAVEDRPSGRAEAQVGVGRPATPGARNKNRARSGVPGAVKSVRAGIDRSSLVSQRSTDVRVPGVSDGSMASNTASASAMSSAVAKSCKTTAVVRAGARDLAGEGGGCLVKPNRSCRALSSPQCATSSSPPWDGWVGMAGAGQLGQTASPVRARDRAW